MVYFADSKGMKTTPPFVGRYVPRGARMPSAQPPSSVPASQAMCAPLTPPSASPPATLSVSTARVLTARVPVWMAGWEPTAPYRYLML